MSIRKGTVILVLLIVTAVVVAAVAAVFWKPFGEGLSAILGGSPDDDVLSLPVAGPGWVDIASGEIEVTEFVKFLSQWSGEQVVLPTQFIRSPPDKIYVATDMMGVTPEAVIGLLRENGWRLRR